MRTAFTDLVGVLAASAYTPAELDAQLTWIQDQTGGRPQRSPARSSLTASSGSGTSPRE